MGLVELVFWISFCTNLFRCVPVEKDPFRKTTKSPDFETEDIENLSKIKQSRLDVIRYNLNHILVELIKMKREKSNADRKIALPPDLASILKMDNVSGVDIDVALEKIRQRLDEVDKDKVEILNEVEISKILDKWQEHVNDTASDRQKAKQEFEAYKTSHHEQEKFHEPGSKVMEKDVWKKDDEMPVEDYSPRNFFLRHDLNSDGVWDSFEIDAVLNSQFDKLVDDRPELAKENRIKMRKHLMKLVDKNQDGVIDYKEHMEYIDSSEAAADDGWEPEDDEDVDPDDFGPIPEDKELDEIAAKIRHYEDIDPKSDLIEQLKDRFVHLKREIELNRSQHP